jgi:predicted GNAT family N-acyltransferase
MARSQREPLPSDIAKAQEQGKRRLDELNAPRLARHLVMFRPDEIAIADLMVMARESIPGLAATSEILKVARHNPDFMLGLARKAAFDADSPSGEGLIIYLPLNLMGMQHLALGTFNAAVPDLRLLAKADERPAGIYLWLVYAPGVLAPGVALMMERLSAGLLGDADIYVRPATEAGRRLSEAVGFTKGAMVGDIDGPNVWVFKRRRPHKPLYDSYVPDAGKNIIGVTLARSWEDMLRVNAIRNAVYIGEQECPYEEEYDGNDLSGTHLLAYMGSEPIGTLRLRFFADFAKIERLAIRKEFRRSQAAFQLVRAGFKFCQKKGYGRIVAHSQVRLVDFWQRFGFHVLEGVKPFVFSDYDYVEMVAELERDPDAISVGTDPYVMIRPEGRWEEPGILEKSAARDGSRLTKAG